MAFRKFVHADLDSCIDNYLNFMNGLERSGDPWTENAVAERLRGILESPVFEGWVLEDKGVAVGFMLGVSLQVLSGRGYDVLELFCAEGRDIGATSARMLSEAVAPLKAEGYVRMAML